MISTSSFEIISNLELRELLQKWDELVKDYQEEELVFKEYSLDNYVPYMSKQISVAAFMKGEKFFDLPNAKYPFLNSIEFESAIALRIILLSDVIFGSELKEMNKTIDRIIELTTTK